MSWVSQPMTVWSEAHWTEGTAYGAAVINHTHVIAIGLRKPDCAWLILIYCWINEWMWEWMGQWASSSIHEWLNGSVCVCECLNESMHVQQYASYDRACPIRLCKCDSQSAPWSCVCSPAYVWHLWWEESSDGRMDAENSLDDKHNSLFSSRGSTGCRRDCLALQNSILWAVCVCVDWDRCSGLFISHVPVTEINVPIALFRTPE